MKKLKAILSVLVFISFINFSNTKPKDNSKLSVSPEVIEQHKNTFKKYVKKQKESSKLYSEKLPNWVVGYNSQARKCFPIGFELFNDPKLDQLLDIFGNHDHDIEHINAGLKLLLEARADKNKTILLLQDLLVERLGLSQDITPKELLKLVQSEQVDRESFAFGVLRNLFINYLKDEVINKSYN